MASNSNKRMRNESGTLRVSHERTMSLDMQSVQKVLCVDDSTVTLKTQCHVLRRALDANGGADVGIDRAMNGEEACAAVRRMSEMGESYLLITMDLSMPKCNGVEATEHVRSNLYRGATTPIVALSSFDPLQPPLSECTPMGQLDAFTFCQEIEKPLTPPKAHQIVQQFVVPQISKKENVELSPTSSEYDGSVSGSYPPSNLSVSGFGSMSSDTSNMPHPHLPPGVAGGGAEACQMAFSPIITPARGLGMPADPAAAPPFAPSAHTAHTAQTTAHTASYAPSHATPFGYVVSYSGGTGQGMGMRPNDMMATDCVPADFMDVRRGFYPPQDGAPQSKRGFSQDGIAGGGPPEADSVASCGERGSLST